MQKITVYVKSCALQKGIHWRNASKIRQPVETPELLQKRIISNKEGRKSAVNSQIKEDEKSLILMRDKQKILLEVTGFKSSERKDEDGRAVYNLLAWVVDDNNEGEAHIRYIAARILDDVWLSESSKLQKIVDQAVTFDGKEVFKVNLDEINQFTQGQAGQRDFDVNYRIQKYSNDGIEKLRDELQNHQLPEQWNSWHEEQGCDVKIRDEGVLVIVTNWLPDPGILHKAGVWRGLAGYVEEPEKKILPAPVPEQKPEPEQTHDNQTQKKETSSNNSLVIVVAVVVGVVIVGAAIWFLTRPPKEPLNPSTPTAPSEIQINFQVEIQINPQVQQLNPARIETNPQQEEQPEIQQTNPQQEEQPEIQQTNPQAEEQLNRAVEEAPLETQINPQDVQPLNPAIVETNFQQEEQTTTPLISPEIEQTNPQPQQPNLLQKKQKAEEIKEPENLTLAQPIPSAKLQTSPQQEQPNLDKADTKEEMKESTLKSLNL